MDLHTPYSTVSFRITLSDLEWLSENFQWHEALRGLSATAELFVIIFRELTNALSEIKWRFFLPKIMDIGQHLLKLWENVTGVRFLDTVETNLMTNQIAPLPMTLDGFKSLHLSKSPFEIIDLRKFNTSYINYQGCNYRRMGNHTRAIFNCCNRIEWLFSRIS